MINNSVPAPFDDNYVQLTNFTEEVTYVNASRIVFPGIAQKFLAASAPKEISYSQFWHMVLQENVRNFWSQNIYLSKHPGDSDCDDHQAGGVEQAEGEPVLALWVRVVRGGDGAGRGHRGEL